MDSSGAVGLDDSQPDPHPSPLPQPRTTSRSLFFSGTDPEEETPLHLVETPAADVDAESASGDPWSETDEWSDDELPTSTASPAGDKPAQLLSKHQLRLTARAAVKTSTGVAHTVGAKTREAQLLGLYKADDEDAQAIGDPLADIAYRRGDLTGGKLSPDANDLLRSMMGVGNYFAKQIAILGEVRAIQAAQVAGEVQNIPGAA